MSSEHRNLESLCASLKIVDANLSWFGYSVGKAMEKAGQGVAREIGKRIPTGRKIAVFCGPGNKGGDGLVAARYLSKNHAVTVFLLSPPKTKEASENLERLQKARNVRLVQGVPFGKEKFDVLVDALLGTGRHGELSEPYASCVKQLNDKAGFKVAIDVPTGFGSTLFFRDDLTVCMHVSKKRKAVVVDVGIPKKLEGYIGPGHVKAIRLTSEAAEKIRLNQGRHKGQNGVLTVVGGSKKYHGAPLFAIEAAAPFVDLIHFFSPEKSNLEILRMKARTSVFITVENEEDLRQAVRKSDCVLIGNGLEENAANRRLVNRLLREFPLKKVVLDAGGMMLADKRLLKNRAVLTPHAGEFKRCFEKRASPSEAKRQAAKNDCIVLLKSPVADIVTDGRKIFRNFTGNPGMTRGGTGDTLAGLVAALATQNGLFLSAQAGVFLNGLAGDLVAKRQRAFTADEVAREIPEAFEIALKS